MQLHSENKPLGQINVTTSKKGHIIYNIKKSIYVVQVIKVAQKEINKIEFIL